MRGTRSALATYQGSAELRLGEGLLSSRIGDKYRQRFEDAQADIVEKIQRRHTEPLHFQAAKTRAAEAISEVLHAADVPCLMKYDALQIAKEAAANHPRVDTGVRRLCAHLERTWRRDPLGSLTVSQVHALRDHYASQHPKSAAAELIAKRFPQRGFGEVQAMVLADAARWIDSQEEYDGFVISAGLDGDHPDDIRARALLRDLVNSKFAAADEPDEPASTVEDYLVHQVIHEPDFNGYIPAEELSEAGFSQQEIDRAFSEGLIEYGDAPHTYKVNISKFAAKFAVAVAGTQEN